MQRAGGDVSGSGPAGELGWAGAKVPPGPACRERSRDEGCELRPSARRSRADPSGRDTERRRRVVLGVIRAPASEEGGA